MKYPRRFRIRRMWPGDKLVDGRPWVMTDQEWPHWIGRFETHADAIEFASEARR